MRLPLVSCIMPTRNRREFVPKAIEYFLRQTYPNKVLVIGDDGESIRSVVSIAAAMYRPGGSAVLDSIPNVEYRRFKPGLMLGAKRNALVEACTGDSLIAHWDDDDWYGPERLSLQVEAMRGFEICGLSDPLFYDLRGGGSYVYHPRGAYAYSATLMYTREYWARGPFPDFQVASATPFVKRAKAVGMMPEREWYVGIAHDSNNSPKDFTASEFQSWPTVRSLMPPADWAFYQSMRSNLVGVPA